MSDWLSWWVVTLQSNYRRTETRGPMLPVNQLESPVNDFTPHRGNGPKVEPQTAPKNVHTTVHKKVESAVNMDNMVK